MNEGVNIRLSQKEGYLDLMVHSRKTALIYSYIVLLSLHNMHLLSDRSLCNILSFIGISDDGYTLTFTPPVKYAHIGIEQTIGNVTFDTRAEVALLTRNVVVRGSVNEDWTEKIEACAEDFNAGNNGCSQHISWC